MDHYNPGRCHYDKILAVNHNKDNHKISAVVVEVVDNLDKAAIQVVVRIDHNNDSYFLANLDQAPVSLHQNWHYYFVEFGSKSMALVGDMD